MDEAHERVHPFCRVPAIWRYFAQATPRELELERESLRADARGTQASLGDGCRWKRPARGV